MSANMEARLSAAEVGTRTTDTARATRWQGVAQRRPARSLLCPLALAAILAVLFRTWLTRGLVTAGDWSYVSNAGLRDFVPFPSLWDTTSSLGQYNILSGPMFPLQAVQGWLSLAHADWAVAERVVWLYPAIAVPATAMYALSLRLYHSHVAALVSALAVVCNSYAYLIYNGGQFTVAVGYGFIPLVIWAYARGQERRTVGAYLLTGGALAVQAMYDIRSSYLTVGVLLLYGLCAGRGERCGRWGRGRALLADLGLTQLVAALLVVMVVHLWWILPSLFVRVPSLPATYTAVTGVRALSYPGIANGLTLFHPFWPTNNLQLHAITGRFFLLPLLVFGALLRRRYNGTLLFAAVLALVSIFLVKGDNDPGGNVYDWLFVHLPGFSSFRDPTKFYQPLAVAYALLLGSTTALAMRGLAWRRYATIGRIIAVGTAALVLAAVLYPSHFLLRPQAAYRGTFATTAVPADIARFNARIDSQVASFRVLWAPATPRYATASARHPAIDISALDPCCEPATGPPRPWRWFAAPGALQALQKLSVRYVVVADDTVPADYIGEAWPAAWGGAAADDVRAVIRTHLPRLASFTIGRLRVFEIPHPQPLVSMATLGGTRAVCAPTRQGSGCPIGVRAIARSPVTMASASRPITVEHATFPATWYDVRVHVGSRRDVLMLAQQYDPGWLAYIEPHGGVSYLSTLWQRPLTASTHVVANGYENGWMLRTPGTYHVVLVYQPQRFVLAGLAITGVALVAMVIVLAWRRASANGVGAGKGVAV